MKLLKLKRNQTDGFRRTSIGAEIERNRIKYKLSNKWQISFEKCLHCKSKKTFHRERKKTLEKQFLKTGILYENCFSKTTISGNTMIFIKYDLCLDCGRDWACVVFCWEKISGRREKVKFIDKEVK